MSDLDIPKEQVEDVVLSDAEDDDGDDGDDDFFAIKPAVVEEKPEVVEEKPEVVEEKPEAVEEKPEVVEEKPEAVEEKPEVVEEKPEVVEENPVEDKPPKRKPRRKSEKPKAMKKVFVISETKPELERYSPNLFISTSTKNASKQCFTQICRKEHGNQVCNVQFAIHEVNKPDTTTWFEGNRVLLPNPVLRKRPDGKKDTVTHRNIVLEYYP